MPCRSRMYVPGFPYPSGQRLCKALLSRPALPGSARTGEVLIGPRAPRTKKGHHEGGLSRYGAPERITRRKAARPSGQRLCKALLSRPALPGSARTGEVLIGPRAPHTKKGHHEGGLSRYGAPERIRTSDTRLRKPFPDRHFQLIQQVMHAGPAQT